MWRAEPGCPEQARATVRDIPAINRLFSAAFTERYRRDGMPSVRVPHLNPLVWQYAIATAGEGAMIWRDRHGDLAAFNFAHRSGTEGWMGPLAVRMDHQGRGVGRQIVKAGIDWLQAGGATTIGLETMPRTIDNIGFYAGMGFRPGPLTITIQGESIPSGRPIPSGLSAMTASSRADAIAACRAFSARLWAGRDFSLEIALTLELGMGDVALHHDGSELAGFLLYHHAPLADARVAEDLRILKLVARDAEAAAALLASAAGIASVHRLPQVTLRCQGSALAIFTPLIRAGWRVHWTDLRMTLDRYPEAACDGIGLSNWEI